MKVEKGKEGNENIEKVKEYILNLGFVCNSDPSAQNLVYSKNEELLITKNNNK